MLIVRNINNNFVVNVNEEYLLNQTFTDLESLVFLDTIKNKIIKIFVNHTLCHTQTFIQTLFTLNKEVTTITHDYSLLFNKYNPYYVEIPTLERNPIDINLYDQIITQNAANLTIYNKYLTDLTKIIICPLPDYKNSKTKNDTNNNKIIIGIIGAIGEIKGKINIENLINYYKNNSLVQIIIFGILDNYDYAYKYNNINELNYLLIKHKPNILLETSLSPETYSYTLTIKKLTQLPIFYLNKTFDSVIVNRLTDYDKKYMFNTINDRVKSTKINSFVWFRKKTIFYNRSIISSK